MKVSLNQAIYYRNNRYNNSSSYKSMIQESSVREENTVAPILSLANFKNVTFQGNQHMEFLLKQSKKLKCAYSGKEMLPPQDAKNIYQSLKKRPNAQSAINLLIHYQKYMHDVETQIFEIFKDTTHKGKKNFQDILIELKPDALARLEEKQLSIISSIDKHTKNLSEPIAKQIDEIKSKAIKSIEDETFNRKDILKEIKKINTKGKDLNEIIKIYQILYKLPKSTKNTDAFIVKYAKESHESIAKRLISTAVATIEHVKPSSRSGEDNLGNFLLVSAEFNNNRHSMPLSEYIMLNDDIDIKKNLQRYIEDVISEVQDKRSPFASYSWYPDKIEESIASETAGTVHLNTESLKITKTQRKENEAYNKLGKKYTIKKK